jgi:adenylate kinase family enzyme
MKTRVKEYKERTEPIFNYLQDRGYKVVEVDGEDSPDGVARNIINYLNGQIEN